MPQPIDNALIYEVLKDVQTRIASLESMRSEVSPRAFSSAIERR